MFNIQGSELIFLLLIALIVLGPEKLPDAIRKFGRAYAEFKKMANGFQGELKQALDEPMRELRDTADAMRAAANFDLGETMTPPPATPAAPVQREQGLNFGSANPRRAASGEAPAAAPDPNATASEPTKPQGLNFGSANPRRLERQQAAADSATSDAAPAPEPVPPKVRPPGGTPVPRRRPAPVAEPVAESTSETPAESVAEPGEDAAE